MQKMSMLGWLSLILVIIGGLNWGFIGVINVNLVQVLLKSFGPSITKIIYIAVGLAAVYMLYFFFVKAKKNPTT
jgi:uncharacterized protein